MKILRIGRLMVPQIEKNPKIHKQLKTRWLKEEKKDEEQRKKKTSKISISCAEHNTEYLLSEIENSFLEGVENSLKQITIDKENVLIGTIREGSGKEKTELPIIIRQMPDNEFEIYLPHAPEKKREAPIWKNYLVKRKLVNKLFGIGIDFKV